MPDLSPTLAQWSAETWIGMFAAQYRTIGIIINLDEVRSPPQKMWEAICEEEPNHHLEARGPGRNGTEGGARPVESANSFAHFTAAGQKVSWLRIGIGVGFHYAAVSLSTVRFFGL